MKQFFVLITHLGFDAARFSFALRTGFAVCLAIAVAWWLGLEHPQWAGMTVWAASLPLRGQLLAKSGLRLLGTLLGALVGVLIVVLAKGEISVLMVTLSLWVAACVAVAHLLRGMVTYGAMLAGYSAALVALVGTAQHADILSLGLDRVLTALTGVLMALLVAWYFTPSGGEPVSDRDLRLLAADTFAHLKMALAGQRLSFHQQQELLSRMASLDSSLEMHGVRGEADRHHARLSRLLLVSLVSLLVWRRQADPGVHTQALIDALDGAVRAFETDAPDEQVLEALDKAVQCSRSVPSLATLEDLLERCSEVFARYLQQRPAAPSSEPEQKMLPLALHRDWIGARQASVRAGIAMLAVGTFWWITGSDIGAYMLLGTAVMTSLFSTFESPVMTMRSVFLGNILGVAGALTCHWLVWPLADSLAQQVMLIFPFVALGVLVFAHRRLAAAAFDYNMVLLLLLQPNFPLQGSFSESALLSLGVISAPLIAMLAFRLIYPVNTGRRIRNLQAMMVHEIEDMARRPESASTRLAWRSRLYHRLLQLVRWADLMAGSSFPVAKWGLTILRLEQVTRRLQALQGQPDLPAGLARSTELALRRIEQLGDNPDAAHRALVVAARRLERAGYTSESALLAMTETVLLDSLALFRN